MDESGNDTESLGQSLVEAEGENIFVDEELEIFIKAYLHDIKFTSKYQTIVNIIYSLTNVGLVAMPYTCSQTGIPLYIISILVVAIVSGYTNYMVIRMAIEVKVRSLEDLGGKAFGPNGYFIVGSFQILFSLLLMIMTLNICGDIFTSIIGDSNELSYLHQRDLTIVVCSILILPFCILTKSMSTLWWTSYFSGSIMITALLSVIILFSVNNDNDDGDIHHTHIAEPKSLWWCMLFTTSFCFANNQKVFSIYSCLRRRNTTRWRYSIKWAYLIMAILAILFGIFGYLSKVNMPNELSNFNYFSIIADKNNGVFGKLKVFGNAVSGIFAVSLLLTFPVDFLVAKTTFRRMINRATTKIKLDGSNLQNTKLYDNDSKNGNFILVNQLENPVSVVESDHTHREPESLQSKFAVGDSQHNSTYLSSYNSETFADKWRTLDSGDLSKGIESALINPNTALGVKIRSAYSNETHDHADRGISEIEDSENQKYLLRRVETNNAHDSSFIVVGLWVINLIVCLSIERWQLAIVSVGIFATSFLVFILPSMIYFRVSLTSDFHKSPIIFGIIPNRLYMLITQILGIVFLLVGITMCIGSSLIPSHSIIHSQNLTQLLT